MRSYTIDIIKGNTIRQKCKTVNQNNFNGDFEALINGDAVPITGDDGEIEFAILSQIQR